MVVYVRMFSDNGGKHAFIYMPRREVRLPEVRFFVVIIEIELERLGDLVVYQM